MVETEDKFVPVENMTPVENPSPLTGDTSSKAFVVSENGHPEAIVEHDAQ